MKSLLSGLLTAVLVASCGGNGGDTAVVVAELFGDVELNPTGNAPLAAEIPFRPAGDMTVVVTVAGRSVDDEDFSASLSVGRGAEEVRLPILGLYPDHANEVSFEVESADGVELGTHVVTIETGPLPDGFPTITAEGDHDAGLFTFFAWLQTPLARAEGVGVMVDRRGQVRWYSNFAIPDLHPMEIWDGSLYCGDMDRALLSYDFLGHELLKIDIGGHGYERIHHDIFLRENGNVLMTVDRTGDPFIEDRVIEIDPARESLRARWNLADVLPDVADLFLDLPMTGPEEPGITNDPVHINALWYDEEDDTLLVCSQRTGVAEVYASGQLKWLLAPHLMRYVDDADGDGVSDSFADGYDPDLLLTRVGDFRSGAYVDERYPVNGRPVVDYSGFVFHYGEFLLDPLDAEGVPIDDEAVRMGFADHPDFAWPFRPHAVSLLPDGHVLLFDNGLCRNFGPPFGRQSFSRAVEYEIVEDAGDGYGGSVRQVWEYRLPGDPPWYAMSVLVSDVDALPNGNRLVTSGAVGSSFILDTPLGSYGDGPHGAIVVEVDPTDNTEVHTLRFSRLVDDEHPPTEFSIYRAERIDPYAYWRGRTLGGE